MERRPATGCSGRNSVLQVVAFSAQLIPALEGQRPGTRNGRIGARRDQRASSFRRRCGSSFRMQPSAVRAAADPARWADRGVRRRQ